MTPAALAAPRSLSDAEFERALLDPTVVFAAPEDVLGADLTIPRKIAILRRWTNDARALQRAENEGMPSRNESMLQRAVLALISLEHAHAEL